MNWYKFNLASFTDEEYENCLGLMEKSRLERVGSITHEETRRMTVFAEWKAKNIIAKTLKIPLEKVQFYYSEKGKPLLDGGSLHFSISHSGRWAAVAVDDSPVGIDIEVLKPLNPHIKKRICTDNDLEFLSHSKDDENTNFFKIWTAKEAYFKKEGTGITNFKSISYKDLSPLHFCEDGLIITVVRKPQ